MSLEAIVFDMDGVLSRTQQLHARAQADILASEFGIERPPEVLTRKYAGRPPGTAFAEEASAEDPMTAYEQKQRRLFELVEEEGVGAVPGAVELVREMDDDYLLAVASGSEPDFIGVVLEGLGIGEAFDAVWSATEVQQGKPAPDVFEGAAGDLGARPEECLVVEDGRAGMQGASEAGMAVIGVARDGESTEEWPADEVVSSLEKLDCAVVERVHRQATRDR